MSAGTGDQRNHRDLFALSDENERQGYAVLARNPPRGRVREPRRFGAAEAFPCGRMSGFLNPVLILDPARLDDIVDAVTWLRSLDMPVTLRARIDVDDANVRDAAVRLGLERDSWEERAMVLSPIAMDARPLPPGLRIEEATAETIDRWYLATHRGFGIPESTGFARDLVPPSMARDTDVRLFSASFDGDPVACSLALRSEHATGVYSVGTAMEARRRGVGTAITAAAVRAGLEWGSAAAVLQASEMGEPVYRAMGFIEVTRYVTYAASR